MKRVVGAVLLAAVGAAVAQDAARTQVEQRVKLTARLIADSSTVQRITASGDPQAVSHLDESRLFQSMAEDLLGKGDLAGARKAVDDALHHISMARRLVPDASSRQAQSRQRYEQMVANLERMIDAWRGRVGPGQAEDGDLVAAIGLVAGARSLGQQQRWDDALQSLDSAERHVLAGMNRLLGSKTLDYTARATTPAEELELELARHQGLADLLPLALRELKPRPDAVTLIERYSEQSRGLRQQAQLKQRNGDTAAALADIRNASLAVQRALAAAGVATPVPTGGTP